ncbi:MAG: DUF3047 domain-containing protein [Spirochaetia bacterium]|jgi:hypothetical protein|nr:DUF3047 domain-containing protein [Spirochaetia bacterium]
MKKLIVYLYFVFLITSINAEVFVSEGFRSMDIWEVLKFPKIDNSTVYTIEDGQFLGIESNNSASGLKMNTTFNVYKYPVLSWSWKAENIIEGGDARKKSGDDYPVRIYVIFKYDPETAGFGEKIQYNAIKLIYGEYPPKASLNYIWSNRTLDTDFLFSPYTKKAAMIPMDAGNEKLGVWQSHSVNILEDYRKLFGSDPPGTASLAIMGDSDNTGEHSLAFIDFIRLESE